MTREERRKFVRRHMNHRKTYTVEVLAIYCGVSQQTIRNDIMQIKAEKAKTFASQNNNFKKQSQMETNTKSYLLRLEVLNIDPKADMSKRSNYPHQGNFLAVMPDGTATFMNVRFDDYDETRAQVYETGIDPTALVPDNVEENMVELAMQTKKEQDDEIRRIQERHDLAIKELELKHRQELEDLRRRQHEGQSEWVSGDTLFKIISTLAGKQPAADPDETSDANP